MISLQSSFLLSPQHPANTSHILQPTSRVLAYLPLKSLSEKSTMVSKMLSFGSFSVSLFFFPEALGGSIIVPFLFWDYNFLCVFIHTHNVYFSQGSWRNKPAGYIHIDNLRRFITEIGSYEYGDQEKSPGMSYASWRTRKMYVCYSVWVWRPELFKILKDVAVKVLHSSLENCIFMSANLNNSAGATGLEKVNFHSSPKKGQC